MRNQEKNRAFWFIYKKKVAKGSRYDTSWNGTEHICCNSKHSHHHRINCKLNSDDLSDLKDV